MAGSRPSGADAWMPRDPRRPARPGGTSGTAQVPPPGSAVHDPGGTRAFPGSARAKRSLRSECPLSRSLGKRGHSPVLGGGAGNRTWPTWASAVWPCQRVSARTSRMAKTNPSLAGLPSSSDRTTNSSPTPTAMNATAPRGGAPGRGGSAAVGADGHRRGPPVGRGAGGGDNGLGLTFHHERPGEHVAGLYGRGPAFTGEEPRVDEEAVGDEQGGISRHPVTAFEHQHVAVPATASSHVTPGWRVRSPRRVASPRRISRAASASRVLVLEPVRGSSSIVPGMPAPPGGV